MSIDTCEMLNKQVHSEVIADCGLYKSSLLRATGFLWAYES